MSVQTEKVLVTGEIPSESKGTKPEELLVALLKERQKTASCAESCTGGYLSKRITDVPGASEVFAGACVTYTCEAKERLTGVSHKTLEQFGAVSEPTAREMAQGVRRVLGTDYGISTTGIAGPGGGTDEAPVGTVWIAVSSEERTVARLLTFPESYTREQIRSLSSENAMSLLLELLDQKNGIQSIG